MKRMHYLLAGLIIPAMLTSCSSEDGVVETPIAPSDKDVPVVKLYANGGGSDTRTTIDNNTGMVNWSGTDKISVNGRTSTSIKLTGAHTAIFEVAAIGPYTAIYPSTAVKSFNAADGTVSLDVPSEQKYKDGDSFADDVNISVAYSETEQLSFKNVCGLLKATIKADAGATLKNIKTVRFNAGMPISGQAKLNPKTMEIAFSGTTKNYIDVVFDTPKTVNGAEEIKVVWSLAPRVYDNWTIELCDETGHILKTMSTNAAVAVSPVSVRRSLISTVKDIQVYPQYYTVEIKKGNTNMTMEASSEGKYWMYKDEKRTFKIKSFSNGYNLRKWTTNQPSMKHTVFVDDPSRIDVTVYTNEIISQVVVEGLVTGNLLWSSKPLKSNGLFFANYQINTEWLSLPISGAVVCPTGWRFPTYLELGMVRPFLLEQKNFYGDKSYSFNWRPTLIHLNGLVNVVFNHSPGVGTIKHNDSGRLTPERSQSYGPTQEVGEAVPMRCVKELID